MSEQVKTEPPVESATVTAGEVDSTDKVRLRKKVRIRRDNVSHEREKWFQPLPHWVWWTALGLAACGAFSVNPILTPFCILMVPVLMSLLWIPGEPPVLLFACGMQWLQASLAVFYTDFYNLSLIGMHGGRELIGAIWLSLIGVLVLAIGIRLALVRRKSGVAQQAEHESRLLQPATIFIWYLVAFVVFYLIGKLALLVPSLRQPIGAMVTLRWVLVFLLAYSVLTRRRYYALLALAVSLEFVTGLLGYFSTFKNVFFVLLVALPTARFLFKGWRLAQFIALSLVVLSLCIAWSVIKSDYREFLNQGSGEQEVVVPVSARLDKLEELAGDLDRRSLEDGMETLIMRVSYVNFFSLCIMNVPENIPHEHGALWLGAVKHVLMPRFLFPNKPEIKDSERTAYYTGVAVAGEEQGTSISIGYMGESYIDFGRFGMFAPVLLLGIFYGLIYRYFVYRGRRKVLGFAMATAILVFGAYNMETSNIKLIGGNLTAFLVMAAFTKIAGEWFWRSFTEPDVPFQSRRRVRRPIKKTAAL